MPSPNPSELDCLQSIVTRLSVTPSHELVDVVPSVSSSIVDRHTIFSKDDSVKRTSEETKLLQKFDNRLALWLDKGDPSERWAAVMLVKAAIEAGGIACLQRAGSLWSNKMLQALSKSNGLPTVQRLMVITLTRILLLTKGVTTLVRELITPYLPQLIKACLDAITSKNEARRLSKAHQKLLHTVLKCFTRLLPNHPTVFRNTLGQLRALLRSIIFPVQPPTSKLIGRGKSTDTQPFINLNTTLLRDACHLFCLLPLCAPKDERSKQWEDLAKHIVLEAHAIADLIFKPVIEDWRPLPSDAEDIVKGVGQTLKYLLTTKDRSFLGIAIPTGTFQGCSRLHCLLLLLGQLLSVHSPEKVNLRLSSIIELVHRISLVTAPNVNHPRNVSMRFNLDVSKEERETLFAELPRIHEGILHLIDILSDRLGSLFKPMLPMFLEMIAWIFEKERFSYTLRAATYRTVAHLLDNGGAALSGTQIKNIRHIIKAACHEAHPVKMLNTQRDVDSSSHSTEYSTSRVAMQNSPERFISQESKGNAGLLLTSVLANVPGQHLQQHLRAEIDRTIVLHNDYLGLIASVLNAPSTSGALRPQCSILPFLARSHPKSLAVEALIRPQMPVLAVDSRDHTAEPHYDELEGNERSDDDFTSLNETGSEVPTRNLDELKDGDEIRTLSGNASLVTSDIASRGHRPPREEIKLRVSHQLSLDPREAEGKTHTQNVEINNERRKSPILVSSSTLKRSASPASATGESPKRLRHMQRDSDIDIAETAVKAATKAQSAAEGSWRTDLDLAQENFSDRVPNPNTTLGYSDEDDADFEIPTLNPDPDTEDELDGDGEDVR